MARWPALIFQCRVGAKLNSERESTLKIAMHSLNTAFVTDFLGRIGLVILFGAIATIDTFATAEMLRDPTGPHWLALANRFASLAFAALVVGMTILRLKPIRSAVGIEPRISALAGSFLSLTLVALPDTAHGTRLSVIALILIVVGLILATCVLLWLGRSYSIMAQSRRLVTRGPYAFVRHPLYLCEEISVIGLAINHFSLVALVIVGVQWLFQLRRMTNEEAVLHGTFPEYADYVARTPKIIPNILGGLRKFLLL